jgi:hypothetical protein
MAKQSRRSKPTSVRLPPGVREAAEAAAAADGRSLSGLVSKVLADWLRERGYLSEPSGKGRKH